MTPYLFVYGTLRSAAESPMGRYQRSQLAREGRVLGSAVMQGRLYDLGQYPGLADSPDPADLVHGEIIELLDPAASLGWLDAYEGIGRGSRDANEYVRQQRPARLAAGKALSAWVYIYCRDVTGLPRLGDGRWSG